LGLLFLQQTDETVQQGNLLFNDVGEVGHGMSAGLPLQ
jgi:hypothetical protein